VRALQIAGALCVSALASAEPQIEPAAAARLLYGGAVAPCEAVDCMIAARYSDDPKAAELALALYTGAGDIAGVGDDELMDGGYRGKIHLVPQLPVHRYRTHLAWVIAATKRIDAFFTSPERFAQATPAYRWRALAFRFVRSVGKRTPSAVAGAWTILYNVEGSLLTSEAGVLDTLFHELFHLNDEDHGDWSAKVLGADYAAIVKRCGTSTRCLAPFAPGDTMVRGGTYYAFQPNNGVGAREYAAELAVRYFSEQSEFTAQGKLARKPFKCGPPENARAWQALVDEFFAGRDAIPACR
jgi:hypothetical protein